jgi:transposase InsO family protein
MKGIKFTASEKLKALNMLDSGKDILYVAKKAKCTERSLYRWKAIYDGTIESLENKSSRPHTPHPNSHTAAEREYILTLYKENPHIGYEELYGELRAKYAYSRHFMSMYHYIRKNHLNENVVAEYVKYNPQPYDTPTMLGVKMQLDVKYVPKECYPYKDENHLLCSQKFYQYTMIDEATRERFIYSYMEQSGYSTVDFVKRAISYFGYIPLCIQTDNGTEFCNPTNTNPGKKHTFDILCDKLHIEHKRIRVRTPRHNGKVERSHRSDQARFYKFLTFETFGELNEKMEEYLTRSNNIPSSALRNQEGKRMWQTPLQKRAELLDILKEKQGKPDAPKIRFLKNRAA